MLRFSAIPPIMFALALGGCMKPGEAVDQGLHYTAGKGMVRELLRDKDATPEAAANAVWCWAMMREATQVGEAMDCGTEIREPIPEGWADRTGKLRDLEYWWRGIAYGAGLDE